VDRTRHSNITTYDQVVQTSSEEFRMMTDYEEFAIPYKKVLSEPKVLKFYELVRKIFRDAGLDELQDFEIIWDLLEAENKIQQKERIWGHKFTERLDSDLRRDHEIIKYLDEILIKQKKLQEKIEAEKNLQKLCGGK